MREQPGSRRLQQYAYIHPPYIFVIAQPPCGTDVTHRRVLRPLTFLSHVPHLPFSQLNLTIPPNLKPGDRFPFDPPR